MGTAADAAYFTGYDPLNYHAFPYGAVQTGLGLRTTPGSGFSLDQNDAGFPMDPFDLELNAYSDANVSSIFPLLE